MGPIFDFGHFICILEPMSSTLTATARDAGKNLTNIRAEGLVPAVVYGPGRETVSISVSMRDFTKVLKEAGESGAVELKLPNGVVTVLIHDIAYDAVRDTPQHIDFMAIDVTKPLEVSLPLEFVGVSPAVKGSLGTLVKVMHEIEVRGLSKDLPHSVEVDISSLEIVDSQITIADIKLPSGVVALGSPDAAVVLIASVKEETDEVAAPIDFASIEVEKKGKKEEEAAAE
jgi:large subunit ribosomal protein L25